MGPKALFKNQGALPLCFPVPYGVGCCLKAALCSGPHTASAQFPVLPHSLDSSAETPEAHLVPQQPWWKHLSIPQKWLTHYAVWHVHQLSYYSLLAFILLSKKVTFARVFLLAPSRSSAPLPGKQTCVLMALPCLLLWVRMTGQGDQSMLKSRPFGVICVCSKNTVVLIIQNTELLPLTNAN